MSVAGRCALALAWLAAGAAHAQTLTIVPNKTSYGAGELITVQIFADPQAMVDASLFARLRFDTTIATPVGVVRNATPSYFDGGVPFAVAPLDCGPGSCDVIDAITPTALAQPIYPLGSTLWATATLRAIASGTTTLQFETTVPGYQLDFGGPISVTGVPITVSPGVPALGLLGWALLAALMLATTWWLRRRAA